MDHVRHIRIALTSLRYVRDCAAITRGDRDAHDAFILSTIANVSAAFLNQATEESAHFATAGSPAPDELLRPISINALAQSLGMPFETVRRRVAGLREEGLIGVTPAGAVILSRTLASPAYTAMVAAHFERAKQFYWDMKALEALPPLAAATAPERLSSELPIRVVSRTASDYFLRTAQPLFALCGSLVGASLLAEVVLSNTEEMDDEALARWAADGGASGRPAGMTQIAKAVSVARETARRHASLLEERHFVVVTRRGLIATAPAQLQAHLIQLAATNLADARRFFATIERFGILADWEAA
ncbi:MAG: Lrp/AsnC family transcriptional regulator [Caulobacter sp.]